MGLLTLVDEHMLRYVRRVMPVKGLELVPSHAVRFVVVVSEAIVIMILYALFSTGVQTRLRVHLHRPLHKDPRVAENSVSMGDPQNRMDPFPNKLRELFLWTDRGGVLDSLVDSCEVIDVITPKDSGLLAIMVMVSHEEYQTGVDSPGAEAE